MKKYKVYLALAIGPALSFGFGFLLNKICMAANGGAMPVLIYHCSPYMLSDDGLHICMDSSTHLKFLADWIHIRSMDAYASPGDLFMLLAENTIQPCWYGLLALLLFRNDDLK